ncbi:hypothetical protein [Roseimicrobium sp. ORNL1]|uniref:hypothetical protein n=1 Tax=Roseimicrobium sp. ORNL1 TaxID=2711231 RepID=UPI0013E1949B|nr:hypothetical protein [Roseimicrobium sp. ORNL1]QIF01576.1 hypothetical protein G5S37_08590 [Roseimicrobium sp. ORNL1]
MKLRDKLADGSLELRVSRPHVHQISLPELYCHCSAGKIKIRTPPKQDGQIAVANRFRFFLFAEQVAGRINQVPPITVTSSEACDDCHLIWFVEGPVGEYHEGAVEFAERSKQPPHKGG